MWRFKWRVWNIIHKKKRVFNTLFFCCAQNISKPPLSSALAKNIRGIYYNRWRGSLLMTNIGSTCVNLCSPYPVCSSALFFRVKSRFFLHRDYLLLVSKKMNSVFLKNAHPLSKNDIVLVSHNFRLKPFPVLKYPSSVSPFFFWKTEKHSEKNG